MFWQVAIKKKTKIAEMSFERAKIDNNKARVTHIPTAGNTASPPAAP